MICSGEKGFSDYIEEEKEISDTCFFFENFEGCHPCNCCHQYRSHNFQQVSLKTAISRNHSLERESKQCSWCTYLVTVVMTIVISIVIIMIQGGHHFLFVSVSFEYSSGTDTTGDLVLL